MLRCFTGKYYGGSKCRFGCNEIESPEHIFMRCPEHKEARKQMEKKCSDMKKSCHPGTILTEDALKVRVEKILYKLVQTKG